MGLMPGVQRRLSGQCFAWSAVCRVQALGFVRCVLFAALCALVAAVLGATGRALQVIAKPCAFSKRSQYLLTYSGQSSSKPECRQFSPRFAASFLLIYSLKEAAASASSEEFTLKGVSRLGGTNLYKKLTIKRKPLVKSSRPSGPIGEAGLV